MYKYIYIYIYIHTHTHTRIHTYTYAHTHVRTYAHAHIRTCAYVHTYTYILACLLACISGDLPAYIHRYADTHVYRVCLFIQRLMNIMSKEAHSCRCKDMIKKYVA